MSTAVGLKHSLSTFLLTDGLLAQYHGIFASQAVAVARGLLPRQKHIGFTSVHLGCGYDPSMVSALESGAGVAVGVDMSTEHLGLAAKDIDRNFAEDMAAQITSDPIVHALYEESLIRLAVEELHHSVKTIRQLPFGCMKIGLAAGDITQQPLHLIAGGLADMILGSLVPCQIQQSLLHSVLVNVGDSLSPDGVCVFSVPGHWIHYSETDECKDWAVKCFYGSPEVVNFQAELFDRLSMQLGEVFPISFSKGSAVPHDMLMAGTNTMVCVGSHPIFTTLRVPMWHLLFGLGMLAGLEATGYRLPVITVATVVRNSVNEMRKVFASTIEKHPLLYATLYVYQKKEGL